MHNIGVLHDDPQRIIPNNSEIPPPPVQSLVKLTNLGLTEDLL